MPDGCATVTALMIGKAAPFRDGETSAIAKHPVAGPVAIGALGLAGDEQVERAHGGPDMAVHLYPVDHHAFWAGEIGAHDLLDDPGAFGSNLAVSGLTENMVHIGDRFRLGTALLEISQPRKPCWKIEQRFGVKGMVATILQTGRCGWYFRVLESGIATAGDALFRIDAGDGGGSGDGDHSSHGRWTVERAFAAIWGASGAFSNGEIARLAACRALTPDLKHQLAARLA